MKKEFIELPDYEDDDSDNKNEDYTEEIYKISNLNEKKTAIIKFLDNSFVKRSV